MPPQKPDPESAALASAIPIPAEFLPGVRVQFDSLMTQAELVMSFPLPDEVEPAPVYSLDSWPVTRP